MLQVVDNSQPESFYARQKRVYGGGDYSSPTSNTQLPGQARPAGQPVPWANPASQPGAALSDPGTEGAVQPQAAPQQPQAPGSPVTANGQIPPPPAQRALAPLTVPQGQTAVYNPTQFQGQLPTYQAQTFQTAAPQGYQAGPIAPSYQADTLAQYTPVDQSKVNGQQNSLLDAIFANPHTLNDDVVSQIKSSNRDAATSMESQLQAQADQANVARGTLGSGAARADQSGREADMINQILTRNRDLDIARAGQDRADELAALQASEGVASGQANRGIAGYNTQLSGQTAQAGLRQAAAASGLQRSGLTEQAKQAEAASGLAGANFNLNKEQLNVDQLLKQFASQADATKFGLDVSNANEGRTQAGVASQQAAQAQDLQKVLAQFGMNKDAAGFDLQNWIAQNANDLANKQFGENVRQFDTSSATQKDQFGKTFGEGQRQFNLQQMMELARYLEQQRQYNGNFTENQRQFNDTSAFNASALNAQQQQALMNAILGLQ